MALQAINLTADSYVEDVFVGTVLEYLPTEGVVYLCAYLHGEFAGVWVVIVKDYSFHTCMLPHTAGRGLALAKQGVNYMFSTGVPLLRTEAPVNNTPATRILDRLGFTKVPTNRTYLFAGERYPINEYILTKEDYDARSTSSNASSNSRRDGS